jgi:iron complex outermembrane receptor protein
MTGPAHVFTCSLGLGTKKAEDLNELFVVGEMPPLGPACSNLVRRFINGQILNFCGPFRNRKSLIAKEIAIRHAHIAGELRANASLGVCAMRGQRWLRLRRISLASSSAMFLLQGCGVAWGQGTGPQKGQQSVQGDLTELSMENLMNMEVSSVSKKDQGLLRTAAAVFVITQEDIRRSGATNIPDLLRMVPGLDVAQIDASNWAVSSRGFNGRFANKVIVLIDGRSLYSPDFAGVFWQAQNLMLEDIERIEVIRGPGATLWGANAVTGVINVLTKKARDTQGGLFTAGGGMQERGFTGARYGKSNGEKLAYRFYGNYFNRGEFQNASGQGAADKWDALRSGMRIDARLTSRDTLLAEADISRYATLTQTHVASFTPPFNTTPLTSTTGLSGDLLTRWTRSYSPRSEFSLQMYYNRDSRQDVTLNGDVQVFDIDFQDRIPLGARNDFTWGADYRTTTDSITPSSFVSINPPSLRTNLASVFLQDEIAIVPGRLWFTPGIRFESTPFIGFTEEPSARLLWSLTENQSLWLSLAQADRTPQRSERGLHDVTAVFPSPGGSLTSADLFGDPAADDEDMLDFEAGYRTQVTKDISIDVSTFYDHYKDLVTQEPGAPFSSTNPVPHTVVPLSYENGMHGMGYGGELSIGWKPTSRWKLYGGYSFLRQVFHLDPGSQDNTSLLTAGDSPRHQFQLRSQLNLPHRTEFDTSVYQVGKLLDQSVPAYTRLDLRAGWHPTESVDFDLIGQNLLAPRHLEFLNNTGLVPTYPTRRVFARLTWRFSH